MALILVKVAMSDNGVLVIYFCYFLALRNANKNVSDVLATWQLYQNNAEDLLRERTNVKKKQQFFEIVAFLLN
jgi:hypothetical protein